MDSTKKQARLAGLFWLLAAATGGFGMFYFRSKVLMPGDAASTAAHITASAFFFRAAVVSNLFSQILLLFFGVTLVHLFKDVNKRIATVLLVSIIMSVALALVNTLSAVGALTIVSPANDLSSFSSGQRDAMALFLLKLSNTAGQGLVEMFWAPFFFSFGFLVIKSRFLPKILGVLLMIMSIGYAINVFTKFLVPHFYPEFFTQMAMLLGAAGGLPTIFWLLIRGAKVHHSCVGLRDAVIA
jgi:hypothetical protein